MFSKSSPAVQVKNAFVLRCSDKYLPAAEVRALPQRHAKEDSMTDKPENEDGKNFNPSSLDDDYTPEDLYSDPMLAGLKEAEAEIEELESQKAELEAQNGAKAPEGDLKAKAEKVDNHMVPKARLDEVLSERDLLRSQIAYMQGLEDARAKQAPGGNQEKAEDGNGDKDGFNVDAIDAAIDAAEQKKLELAEKYDEGEISTRDWKAAELAIDKEIRGLTDKREVERLNAIKESSRSETDAALNAQRAAAWLNEQTLAIQEKHPNVAVIDATPKHIRDGIWQQINDQALQNLSNQGINVKDTSPNTRIAIIQEKARLTDSYTAENLKAFLPQGFRAPTLNQANSQTPAQRQLSETARNRAQKLELADSQPPSISDLGAGAGDGELTEADIESMSEDQLADIIQRAPARVQRALGLTQL